MMERIGENTIPLDPKSLWRGVRCFIVLLVAQDCSRARLYKELGLQAAYCNLLDIGLINKI